MRARYAHPSLAAILATLCLAACSAVYFDTPMPLNTGMVSGFDAAMVGSYEVSDSLLVGRNDTIYNAAYYEVCPPARDSFAMFSLQLNILKNQAYYRFSVFMYNRREGADRGMDNFPVRGKTEPALKYRKNGFTVYEKSILDTILDLRKKDKLRLYDKAYYLNHRLDVKRWVVYRFKPLSGGMLSVGMANRKDQEKLQPFITKKGLWAGTAHLSDEQFLSFVKQGGFRQSLKFRKKK